MRIEHDNLCSMMLFYSWIFEKKKDRNQVKFFDNLLQVLPAPKCSLGRLEYN